MTDKKRTRFLRERNASSVGYMLATMVTDLMSRARDDGSDDADLISAVAWITRIHDRIYKKDGSTDELREMIGAVRDTEYRTGMTGEEFRPVFVADARDELMTALGRSDLNKKPDADEGDPLENQLEEITDLMHDWRWAWMSATWRKVAASHPVTEPKDQQVVPITKGKLKRIQGELVAIFNEMNANFDAAVNNLVAVRASGVGDAEVGAAIVKVKQAMASQPRTTWDYILRRRCKPHIWWWEAFQYVDAAGVMDYFE
jgi:hypothetical protein